MQARGQSCARRVYDGGMGEVATVGVRTLRLSGARAQFCVTAGILVMRLAGPITVAVVRCVRDQIADADVAQAARVALMDLRRGVLVAAPVDMKPTVEADVPGLTGRLSTALLVTEQEAAAYREYAALAAWAGYTRRVFTDEDAAWGWAQREARLPPW